MILNTTIQTVQSEATLVVNVPDLSPLPWPPKKQSPEGNMKSPKYSTVFQFGKERHKYVQNILKYINNKNVKQKSMHILLRG